MSSPERRAPDAGPAAPVTEAARAQAAELAEALADVVYALRIEPDMAFEFISPSVLQLTGYPPEDYYADAGIAVANTAPEYQLEIQLAYSAEPGVVTDFTVPWTRRDGHVIWTHHRCRKQVRSDGTAIVYAAARDVTAQVEAENALAASQDRYRLLAENASDVVWRTDTAAKVEWVSPSVESVMGWTPGDLVGTRITELAHPDDLARVRSAGDATNEGGRVSFEARYACQDGSYRWLEVTARPLTAPDGTVVGRVGSCRDVHSEIEAWHALERSEQRFRLAMESAPTGMAVLDLDGHFIEVNAELCRMLGHDSAWLLDHGISDMVHPSDDEIDMRMRDEILSGRAMSATNEIRLIRRDHAIVWVQLALGLLRDEDGRPLSFVSQLVNVTEAHDSREALRFMATHDPLTMLLNRRELLARMSLVLAHPSRGHTRMAVLFADLDGLKQVNDTLGHSAGDQLIIEAGRRITSSVRDGDLTARLGGDEFVVVLPEAHGLDDALAVARKITERMSIPLHIAGEAVSLGVSIGVTLAGEGDDATTLLRQADAALYRAKESGRNRVEVFATE